MSVDSLRAALMSSVLHVAMRRGSRGRGWYTKFMEAGPQAFQKHNKPAPFDWTPKTNVEAKRSRAFFDVTLDGQQMGRVVFQLADDVCPKTVNNFKRLCSGDGRFSYTGTQIHHVNKLGHIMGGDVEHKDGRGSHSSFDQRFFPDENFIIPHSEAGVLSMASVGAHTNGSQFYITVAEAPYLDGRCVAFGKVEAGTEVLEQIKKLFTMRGKPAQKVTIASCGILED